MSADQYSYIGLMSGTSADAIDAILVEFPLNREIHIHASCSLATSTSLKDSIIRLNQPSDNEIELMADLECQLARHYAQAVDKLLAQNNYPRHKIRTIGMHGQTIRHRPDRGYSLQIGNAALLTELTRIDVIADFRSRDVAAGGQGAPLAPLFHSWLWRDSHPKAVLNLGGFANLTLLPAEGREAVIGFDTGPANVLLDGWAHQHKNVPYDDKGLWAASGTCNKQLLRELQSHIFFAKKPPKSTGRDEFNLNWLHEKVQTMDIAAEDVQASLLELTAKSISTQLIENGYHQCQLIVCGGGCHNYALMDRLRQLLPQNQILTTDKLGIAPEYVEAAAFAWLAMRCLQGKAGNLPSVTEAQGERVLGAHYQA